MKFVLFVALLAFALANPFAEVFHSEVLSDHVHQSLSNTTFVSTSRPDKKFPFEAVLAGAKLGKIIFTRAKSNNYTKLSRDEFHAITDLKSAYPIGAILAGPRVGKHIHTCIKHNPNVTLEFILSKTTFPWKYVVKAAKKGRKAVQQITTTSKATPKIIKKILSPPSVDIKKIVAQISKSKEFNTIVNTITKKVDQEIIALSSGDDDEECKRCKRACYYLPYSARAYCISQCDMSRACRDGGSHYRRISRSMKKRDFEVASADLLSDSNDDDSCRRCKSACYALASSARAYCLAQCDMSRACRDDSHYHRIVKRVRKDQYQVASDSQDDERCDACKQGCKRLPNSVQRICKNQCESSVCRSDRRGFSTFAEVQSPKCLICRVACKFINSHGNCDSACGSACKK